MKKLFVSLFLIAIHFGTFCSESIGMDRYVTNFSNKQDFSVEGWKKFLLQDIDSFKIGRLDDDTFPVKETLQIKFSQLSKDEWLQLYGPEKTKKTKALCANLKISLPTPLEYHVYQLENLWNNREEDISGEKIVNVVIQALNDTQVKALLPHEQKTYYKEYIENTQRVLQGKKQYYVDEFKILLENELTEPELEMAYDILSPIITEQKSVKNHKQTQEQLQTTSKNSTPVNTNKNDKSLHSYVQNFCNKQDFSLEGWKRFLLQDIDSLILTGRIMDHAHLKILPVKEKFLQLSNDEWFQLYDPKGTEKTKRLCSALAISLPKPLEYHVYQLEHIFNNPKEDTSGEKIIHIIVQALNDTRVQQESFRVRKDYYEAYIENAKKILQGKKQYYVDDFQTILKNNLKDDVLQFEAYTLLSPIITEQKNIKNHKQTQEQPGATFENSTPINSNKHGKKDLTSEKPTQLKNLLPFFAVTTISLALLFSFWRLNLRNRSSFSL